jgi:membrane protein EpsK
MSALSAVFRNSAWSVFALAVSMVVALFYTPYLVGQLGIAAYGMVPLITGLFVWVSWISLGVSWSVGRYVTIASERGEVGLQNIYFNSAFLPAVLLALVVGGIGVSLMPLSDRIIRVPEGTANAVTSLWACGAIVASIGIVSGVVEVGAYCRNRFDVKAMIQIGRTVITVLTVLVLFRARGPRLEWIGIGTLIGSAAGLGGALLSLKLLMPEVKFRPAMFSRAHFREMIGTNAWILVDQLGTIFLLNIDLILVNRFFGPRMTGEYGLASQWTAMLKALMTAMTVFTPIYVTYVAREDLEGLAAYATKAARFVGFTMAVPLGVMLGLAVPLTTAWLHGDPGLVPQLIVVQVFFLTFNVAVNPLYGIWQALNKLRVPSIATLVTGAGALVVAVVLSRATSLGVFVIPIAFGVAFTARNLVFTIYYVGRLLQCGQSRFIRVSLKAAGAAVLIGLAGRLATFRVHPVGWIEVGMVGLVLTGFGAALVWFWCLEQRERQQLMRFVELQLVARNA